MGVGLAVGFSDVGDMAWDGRMGLYIERSGPGGGATVSLGMGRNTSINFRASAVERARLREIAAAERLDPSEWLRRQIDRAWAERRGSVPAADPDLVGAAVRAQAALERLRV